MVILNQSSEFSIGSLVRRLHYNHKIGETEAYLMLMHVEEKLWERNNNRSDDFSVPRCYVQAYNVLDRFYAIKKRKSRTYDY